MMALVRGVIAFSNSAIGGKAKPLSMVEGTVLIVVSERSAKEL